MRKLSLVLILLMFTRCCALVAQENHVVKTGKSLVTFSDSDFVFPVYKAGQVAHVYYDPMEDKGVVRAIGDLMADISRVSGVHSDSILHGNDRKAIVVGIVGSGGTVDRLAKASPEVLSLKGKWEQFYITVLDHPEARYDQVLLIAGSDKRGAIYGIYELSRQMGVSPWYWWADVPVIQREFIGVNRGMFTNGEPAVKYRGIFINDENPALKGWVDENYGGFNHHFYEKVFELILRLKGNYLWPAMWSKAIYDDDPLSPVLANEYGIVLGTSHHEPLMRAHVEWERYGEGDWNYETNKKTLQSFWKEGIERMGSNESIVSIGMRGDGDKPMTEESNIALLEEIVRDQRQIIEDVTGRPASETPQMWALYKEVQEYYDKGMRVPDDVILLLCDDNWGNIRKLPKPGSQPRSGGYGIYYHFDYVGGPRNYKWINTNHLPRIWEQMQQAWAHGVDKVWIVNVGDIKPMELPTQFFLDMAWDPDAIGIRELIDYPYEYAREQFVEREFFEIGYILNQYGQMISRRKPELLNLPVYSIKAYNESAQVVQEWQCLEKLAGEILDRIPWEYFDACYQLVYFPVAAASNVYQLYHAYFMHRHYYEEDRGELANAWADKVRLHFARDSMLTEYYHTRFAGGKWNHIMSQTHIGYTNWQQPPVNTIPELLDSATTDSKPSVIIETNYPDRRTCFAILDSEEHFYIPRYSTSHGYVEIDGIISIPVTLDGGGRASSFVNGAGIKWTIIPFAGRIGHALKGMPPTLSVDPDSIDDESPHVFYRLKDISAGSFDLDIHLAPTIDFYSQGGFRIGVSLDDGEVSVVNIHDQTKGYDWSKSVSWNCNIVTTPIDIPGGNHELNLWYIDPGVVLERIVLRRQGVKDPTYLGPPSTLTWDVTEPPGFYH